MGRETGREDAAGHRSPADVGGEPQTLRLWAEDLSCDRARIDTGRVRVRRVTRRHHQTVELPLTRDIVEVERVPIGRDVETAPPVRQEGDVTIIPITEEVAAVQRRLVLKEELHLKRVRTTEQHRQTVTLRRQEAVVERLPAEQPSPGRKPVPAPPGSP